MTKKDKKLKSVDVDVPEEEEQLKRTDLFKDDRS